MLVPSQKKISSVYSTTPRMKQRAYIFRKYRLVMDGVRQIASKCRPVMDGVRQIASVSRRMLQADISGLRRVNAAWAHRKVVDLQSILSGVWQAIVPQTRRAVVNLPILIQRLRQVSFSEVRGIIAEQLRHATIGRMQMHLPGWKKTAPALVAILLTPLTLGALGVSPGAVEARLTDISTASASGMERNIGAIPEKPPAPPAPQKKFAVVIGIVYPDNDLGVVKYADRDAASVYNLLTEKWGFPRENVVYLRNGEATRDNIDNALKWLSTNPAIDAQSDVVFFYSGHGLRNAPGGGYQNPNLPGFGLVPYDYNNFDFRNTGDGLLFDTYLASLFSHLNPGRMWIAIDSCFSEGYNRPGIAGANRVVTLSSRADQVSGEIDETGSGVFTQLMINNGVVRGIPLEQAYNEAVPPAVNNYGQGPVISDNYPGGMNFFKN